MARTPRVLVVEDADLRHPSVEAAYYALLDELTVALLLDEMRAAGVPVLTGDHGLHPMPHQPTTMPTTWNESGHRHRARRTQRPQRPPLNPHRDWPDAKGARG